MSELAPRADATPSPAVCEQRVTAPAGDAEVETFRRSHDWFVVAHASDGQRWICDAKQLVETLRTQVLDGVLTPASTVDVHARTTEGQWKDTSLPLGEFAKGRFRLRVLYAPVWSHAMAGLKWGALIGICVKFLDTLFLLSTIDPRVAILFAVVAGVCMIPRIGVPAVIMISITATQFTRANLFATFLSVMLTGAILGCLPGMAIGATIGLGRKRTLPVARDATPESESLALTAVVLPLLGAAVVWSLYLFVLNPWLAGWMEAR